jgi:hypothetical protein
MRLAKKSGVVVIAAIALLFSAATVRADNFTLTYSGTNGLGVTDISGTVYLTASNNGNGTYTVTSIGGSQTLLVGGVDETQTISNIQLPTTPPAGTYNGTAYSAYNAPGVGTIFYYDDLIAPSSVPQLDLFGLVFQASGEADDVNFCTSGSISIGYCGLPGVSDPYWELVYVGSGGNDPNPVYQDYGITSVSLVDPVPEPSTLLLLGSGLMALFFLARRKQFAGLEI